MKEKKISFTRKKESIIKLSAIVVIIIVLWLFFGILMNNDNPLKQNSLNSIKKGTLNECPNYTIEELINNYMTNIKWTKEKTDKSYYVYNVSGNIYYNEEEENALIQFAINGDNIVIKDFEIDKIPQTNSMYSKLVEDMCNEITIIEVPDVSGKTSVEAESILEEAGFDVSHDTIFNEKVEKGKVIKTSPEANKSAKRGTKIIIYESLGSEKYEVEDYTGKNYIEVKTTLEQKYNLNVSVEKKDVNSNEMYYDNEIIAQSVPKGTFLENGDNITLYIPNISN